MTGSGPEIIPAVEFNDAVSAAFTRHIAPLGFERFKGHRWVCGEHAALRRVFSLYSLKGFSIAPTWGFSIDFVPHLAGGDVKWHRTAKSAQLDLPYDPIDYTPDVRSWSLSRSDPRGTLERQADALATRAVAGAASFSSRIAAVASGSRIMCVHRSCMPFVLAHLGRIPEAEEWLERYLANDIRPEAKLVLRQRLRDAQLRERLNRHDL